MNTKKVKEAESILTPRQYDVFLLILKGMNNKEIGQKLGITYGTAKLVSNAVLKKLKVASKNILMAKYL